MQSMVDSLGWGLKLWGRLGCCAAMASPAKSRVSARICCDI